MGGKKGKSGREGEEMLGIISDSPHFFVKVRRHNIIHGAIKGLGLKGLKRNEGQRLLATDTGVELI